MSIDLKQIRSQFPVLRETIRGKPLIYLDSAATALKPISVLQAMDDHYRHGSSNVHRGVHFLSDQATLKFESAREEVRKFLGAEEGEIVFTHGTTESINLVAFGMAEKLLKPDDEILLTEMEHHSNLVPWQMAAARSGAKVKYIPVLDSGELDMEAAKNLVTSKTKVMAFTAASNTLGTLNPVETLVALAKSVGAVTLVDAAQAVANQRVDVRKWNCDFLAFSGHKLFGPTGIGVLYGKREILNSLPPMMGGGGMIDQVTWEKTTYLTGYARFEAGTPHIAGAIGLGAAIQFVQGLGWNSIQEHEAKLVQAAQRQLSQVKGLRLVGEARSRIPIFSFILEGCHPQDVGTILDQEGIAIRTGHHCTQPLLKKFGYTGTCRASFSIYSLTEEVQQLCEGLEKARKMLV